MENMEIIKKFKTLYDTEGFHILGIFGSIARGDANEKSDIDILYEIDSRFTDKYGGFGSIRRLEEIKNQLHHALGRNIGLSAKNSLNETGKKYILSELLHV